MTTTFDARTAARFGSGYSKITMCAVGTGRHSTAGLMLILMVVCVPTKASSVGDVAEGSQGQGSSLVISFVIFGQGDRFQNESEQGSARSDPHAHARQLTWKICVSITDLPSSHATRNAATDRFFHFECVRMDPKLSMEHLLRCCHPKNMNTYGKANRVGMWYETLTSSIFSLPTLAASSSASDVMIARRFI